MKAPLLLAITLLLAHFATLGARAQSYVAESAVTLNATVLSQGPDASVTTVQSGTTITTKKVVATPLTNHEVLSAMVASNLIPAPLQGWNIVLRVDAEGNAGLFARKLAQLPVAVPADLLTLPNLGPRVAGGITVTAKDGTNHGGLSETAFATITAGGVPASGLATTTPSHHGKGTPSPDAGKTVLNFAGGVTVDGASRLVRGTLEISGEINTPSTGNAPLH